MRASLLAWFARERRPLPWREPSQRADPYRVLVAEVMLQQTQVATVVPYYRRWLQRFPDPARLAAADDDAVLHAWQGLGYYRRALNLKRAAQQVVDRHGGRLPDDRAALERLPGVGPYTAAALSALAFGRTAVAIDGNVRRLASRLHAWATPPGDAAVERALLARFGAPAAGEAGAFAEALIELGALVCTPGVPACERCPLASGCAAVAEAAPERYPRPRPRRSVPSRRRYALVALDGDRVWLERRAQGGLLGGLWGFPQALQAPPRARRLEGVRHAYSHFRLELVPVLVTREHPALRQGQDAGWTPLASLRALALSTVDRRVLARLAEHALVPPAAGAPPAG